MSDKFPEILLLDARTKLINLRIPSYLLIFLDGYALSEIVLCLFWLMKLRQL